MKNSLFVRLTTFLLLALAASTSGAAAVKKKVPVSKSAVSKSSVRKKSGKAKGSSSLSRSRKKVAVKAQSWRNRQAAPSSERYKEIQQALVAKGYLKSEPNGVWDAQSQEAMKQFQTDQKLSPTGKITSSSLIGLGLGPKQVATPATVPASPSGTGESPLTPE